MTSASRLHYIPLARRLLVSTVDPLPALHPVHEDHLRKHRKE